MFATTLIPSGTRIICEEETVVLPDGADYPDLYKLVDALPEHRQAPFWALAAYNRKHEVDWIPAVRAEYKGKIPDLPIQKSEIYIYTFVFCGEEL